MLIYEPTIYDNLDCSILTRVVDYRTEEYIGDVSSVSQHCILVKDGDFIYCPSGLSKEAPCLQESANYKFNFNEISNMAHSVLWYYSLKNNNRVKC
jgi:hypothetical protein